MQKIKNLNYKKVKIAKSSYYLKILSRAQLPSLDRKLILGLVSTLIEDNTFLTSDWGTVNFSQDAPVALICIIKQSN